MTGTKPTLSSKTSNGRLKAIFHVAEAYRNSTNLDHDKQNIVILVDEIERLQERCVEFSANLTIAERQVTEARMELDRRSVETNERQREIKRLEQVVRLNPAEYDPSVATCPCGACEHYRKLFRQQGTPLDQLGKPNAVKASEAPFGTCSKCKQPIDSFHNINGCPAENGTGDV